MVEEGMRTRVVDMRPDPRRGTIIAMVALDRPADGEHSDLLRPQHGDEEPGIDICTP